METHYRLGIEPQRISETGGLEGNKSKKKPGWMRLSWLVGVMLIGFSLSANAQVAIWDFTGEDGDQASTSGTSADNVTALDFARGADINPSGANNSISSNGWDSGDDRFFTFGFDVDPGFTVDLTNLVIRTR